MDRTWTYLFIALACFVCKGVAFGDDNLFWCSADKFVFLNATKSWLSGSTNVNPRTVNIKHQDALLSASSYFYRKDYLVFSDKGTRTIFLYKDKPNPSGVFAHIGVSEGIGELAVDWLNFNMYWCDSIYSWIGLQAVPLDINTVTYNDKQRIVVEKALKKPYGIAVAPEQRYIFWTDYGETPRIERASLTGQSRRTLIWMGLKKPMSITVDPSTSKLFWIDSARASLETCDFEGQGRHVLLQRRGFMLTSVTVFEEHLLYTEAKEKSIHAVSKVTGLLSARALEIDVEPIGVSVFSESLQPFSSSPCDSHGCSHICVQEGGGPSCLCEGGFTLAVDGKTCSASSPGNLWKSIIYSSGSRICAIPVTTFNSQKYIDIEVTCLTSGVNINFLAPDVQSSSLFYSSGQSIRRKMLGGGNFEIATASNEITGLAVDSLDRKVIWSEKDAGVIKMASFPINSTVTVIFSNRRSPAALAIDTKNRKLFWISATSPARIEMGSVTGGTASVLVGSDLKQPVRLTFDPQRNRLFWTEDGNIGSILVDGRNRWAHSFSPLPTYFGITVFKDYLVWTTTYSSVNMSVSVITDGDGDIDGLTTFKMANIADIKDIVVFDTDNNPADINGCDSNNGGCQHICLPMDNTHKCQCDLGFSLQSDNKTCRSGVVDSDFFLVVDDVHNCIYEVVSSDVVHGVGILADNTPNIIAYDTQRRKVVWYDGARHLINKANMNGSDQTVVISTEKMVVKDMRVDQSTGNIYYTMTSGGGSGSVRVMTHDGLVKKTLIQTTQEPGPLVIYPKFGLMIWGEGNVIKKADMTGSDVSTLLSSNLTSVTDLDIDPNGETLYIADSAGDKLESLVLQTRSRKTLRKTTQEFPVAIAIKGDNLYYLASSGRNIKVIHKKTGGELPAASNVPEFGHLSALYVYTEGQVTANPACSKHNGGCSQLCLPTASDSLCACRDGDLKTCQQAVKCPEKLLNGRLSTDCPPYANSVCSFTCNDGYESSVSSRVSCSTAGDWNVSLATLCVAVRCPDVLLHGKLSSDCSRYANNVCSITCDEGYETKLSSQISCSNTGVWSTSLDTLCVARTLPPTTSPTPVALIVGVCAAVLVVVAVIVMAVICYKRRRAAISRHPRLVTSWSKQPIITISKDEIYDEVSHNNIEPDRYASFSRISPGSQRRNLMGLSEINNPAYNSSQQYLTVADRLPVPVPRPASSFTPNTRRKMYRSESPAPDYSETPKSASPSASYVDLTDYQDGIPSQSLKV